MCVSASHPGKDPLRVRAITWVLLFPLLFLTVHGQLFFLGSNTNVFAPSGAGGGVQRSAGESLVDQGVKVTIAITFYALAALRMKTIKSILEGNLLIGAIIALVLISVAWSQFPVNTLEFGTILISNIAFALYLSARFDAEEQMRLFAFVGAVAAISTIAVVLFLPGQGIDYKEGGTTAWQGIFNHKNDCAIVMSYLLTGAVYSDHLRKRLPLVRLACIGLFLVVIAMSESRTGWILVSAFFAYLFVVRVISHFGSGSRPLLYLLAAACSIGLIVGLVANASEFFLALGKSENATGRTVIWLTALRSIWKRPLLGYGYHAFFMGMQGESANTATVFGGGVPMMHAQSGFLDVWLDLGIVGLGLISLTIVRSIKNGTVCLLNGKRTAAQWYLSIVILTVIANIGERNFMNCNFVDWLMYVVAYVGLNREAAAVHSGTQPAPGGDFISHRSRIAA